MSPKDLYGFRIRGSTSAFEPIKALEWKFYFTSSSFYKLDSIPSNKAPLSGLAPYSQARYTANLLSIYPRLKANFYPTRKMQSPSTRLRTVAFYFAFIVL